MRLFGKKKKEDYEGIPVRPASKDFDIDDIDLPPLPDMDDDSSEELEFSNKMPQNEDLPPLPEAPKPYYHPALPKKYEAPTPVHKLEPLTPPPRPIKNKSYDDVSTVSVREDIKAPVFVKVDKYREVLEVIDSLKKDLKQLSKSLGALRDSKTKEDEIITGWNGLLSEIATKLDKIDSGLFEPEE